MLMQKLLKRKAGFTLVELLIVIAIIAILAAIAIPQFTQYRNRAFKTELDSDAKNAYTASQAYLTDAPGATVGDLGALTTGGYVPSPNITFVAGDMTLSTGSVELKSTSSAWPAAGNNNAVIHFNGAINFAAAP